MTDYTLGNCRIPGRDGLTDISVRNGVFAGIAPAETSGSSPGLVERLDMEGRLVSAPFVDAHFHLDSVLTGIPNATGTLREGIDNWGLYKEQTLSVDDVFARGNEYCERALSQGLLAIRSHVDVSDSALRGVEGLIRLREEWKNRIDIQLVAFPQDGFYGSPDTEAQLLRSLDMGVDVVGGIPHNERTMELGWRSLERLLDIAEERGLMVDIHCDESDDPQSRHVEVLAEETRKRGLAGRVAASHITSTAMMDPYYLHRKLIPLMAGAGLSVIVNPLINIHLGGHFHHPSPRGMAPIKDFLAAGMNVACAQDCNEDPWYPLGNADMFEVAKMAAHIAHMMGTSELETLFEAVTTKAAAIMNLDGYGIEPGHPANYVVFEASGVLDAMRVGARRKAVVRNGHVLRGALET